MICLFPCFISTISSPSEEALESEVQQYKAKKRDACISTFALAVIALTFLSIAFGLFGVGTLSPTALMGLGMLPYLVGTFLSFLGIGVLIGGLTCGAASGYYAYQHSSLVDKQTESN